MNCTMPLGSCLEKTCFILLSLLMSCSLAGLSFSQGYNQKPWVHRGNKYIQIFEGWGKKNLAGNESCSDNHQRKSLCIKAIFHPSLCFDKTWLNNLNVELENNYKFAFISSSSFSAGYSAWEMPMEIPGVHQNNSTIFYHLLGIGSCWQWADSVIL